jgi:hypothetical protein
MFVMLNRLSHPDITHQMTSTASATKNAPTRERVNSSEKKKTAIKNEARKESVLH